MLGGTLAGRSAWLVSMLGFAALAAMAMILFAVGLSGAAGGAPAVASTASRGSNAIHLGVASCSGSTCHGRSENDGTVVRQDELMRWQEESSPSGAHSRAFRVLSEPRSQAIAQRLGIGSATSAPMCLGCHADPVSAGQIGPRFQLSDGVGCESCHGGSQNWISSHYAVGATHQGNVAAGLYPLTNPRARADKCLDCHFGSDRPGQFVNHRIMAAGHPRVSFELDLFSTLQQHHDDDADYVRRKGKISNVRMWAVGQASALDRALSLYSNQKIAQDGIFPEFYFFDCHTCHRRISDDANFRATAVANPARPIPSGMPAFNDENMIMLTAAARAAAPALAGRLDADSRAFHAALATDRASAVRAAGKLRATAEALANSFAATEFSRAQTFAIVDAVASNAVTARLTDYEGSVQAVMATDTLLNALVNSGQVGAGSAAAIRGDINQAYAAVRDPNSFRPAEFRAALGRAANAIRALR
ncbi:Cytochrome c554 and c-prime [Sphingomonas laterariae]|uniref:Cytochrome c554 and c-prime n=1 Tax=Edaphosphingomonas laterariae TaxID=861865 RepID=A0A239BIX4_9SPHN|nr:multiheme c-type cytochrome [Sphingomonas laterariae]SNS07013.1 Cytochrome c554 and c-prime [Sphingomonas laterariae]